MNQQQAGTTHVPYQDDDLLRLPWTPFVPAERDPRDSESAIWHNSRYQVHLRIYEARDGGLAVVQLSFKRHDRRTFIPYRDKMRIKDDLVGPECEGVELFPARSREVDTANQYHLWVIADEQFRFPLGFSTRLVSEASIPGSTQEPWPDGERPTDCLSAEALAQLVQMQRGGNAHG